MPAEFYDTDCGSKKSMAKSLQANPNRMSIMKSGTRRFNSQPSHLVTPFGVYQLDTAHKKSLSTGVRDTKRFYAAPFYAKTRSTACGDAKSAGPGCSYDVQALTSGQAPTFQESVAQSPILYTVMRSKLARVAKAATTEGPDIIYDTDTMQKQCLVTKIQTSPILYANMSRSKVQRSGLAPSNSCPADIGPGAYDCPIRSDIRTSLVLKQNPLSSMLSNAPRLSTEKVDPTKNLGSTWKQERDTKYWNRGQTIAKAYPRF